MSRGFVQHVTLTGKVLSLSEDAGQACFTLETRSEDRFVIYVTGNTWWRSLKNLDEIDRDRYGEDDASRGGEPEKKIRKYLNVGRLVLLEGVLFQNELKRRIDARTVYLLYSQDDKPVSQYEGKFLFEGGHWWLNQIRALADQWLESLFPEKDTYDFHGYRSNLDFEFHPTKDNTQECATMSRLIYGLSSAFLLTGTTRYLDAARAGVEYQRKHFKTLSHDGESVIWAFAKKGAEIIIPSQNGEDFGSVPLYEQIYCLAGLTQYYRATLDRAVLEDIRLTVNSFQKFFRDTSALKGYFSHLDYATMKTTSPSLGDNSNRKNWNSVGDHIPAYLINLLLALEPLEGDPSLSSFIRQARELLKETTTLIVEKFPQKGNPYVMERFHADWTPDTTHGWQQNRAVVGHNLKIAWNLTRVAFYYASKENPDVNPDKLLEVANFLAEGMVKTGAVDVFRGGIYDCVERNPQNGQSVEFAWMNTKDFWQQEQAILAYYILYGYTKNNTYLELAREMSVFWNAFFLDHDNKGVYFRTTDDGVPIVKDSYGIKAGHAIAGYHMFELNYLAHVYVMSYAAKKPYTLYFQPAADTDATALGVLPDFVDHKTTHISSVTVNGQTTKFDKITCSVPLKSEHRGKSIKVEISVDGEPAHPAPAPKPKLLHKIGVLVESHFDETEVREFEKVFPQHGYELVYISNLWNQDFLDFTGNDHNDPLRVRVDVSKVNIPDYKGFLFIGGYAMDRLRYESLPKQGEENQSPLAKFVRKLADHPEVKIGTICHSLWAFTVVPELLKGKKVTCANNVIYDVLNAGGEVQYEKEGATKVVVVDGNLITGNHPANTKQFAAKFLEELQSSTIA